MLNLTGLFLHLTGGIADLPDKLAHALHGVVEVGSQGTELILAVDLDLHCHVAAGHLPHLLRQAFEGSAGSEIEPGVQVNDQQPNQR